MSNYRLGNYICELRKESGMDQKTLATLLGVSSSAISQCENGGGIKTEKLYQLSELFGVTLDELINGRREEQSIENRLDDLYFIDENELQQAVNSVDYKKIAELFQRIKKIRERFEMLIYKRIFAKVTIDENVELEYLKHYYNENIFASQYFTSSIVFFDDCQRYDYIKENLLNAIDIRERATLSWELNKIFSCKIDLHLNDILQILISDEKIENEENRLECFIAVFKALPTLSKDLLFSQFVCDNGNFSIKIEYIKAMLDSKVNLLFPKVRNMLHLDEEVINSLEGDIEYDKKLTNANSIYENKFIFSFDYKDFIRLTYNEYLLCINRDGMRDIELLADLWQNNKKEYWNKYKTINIYGKNPKEGIL